MTKTIIKEITVKCIECGKKKKISQKEWAGGNTRCECGGLHV